MRTVLAAAIAALLVAALRTTNLPPAHAWWCPNHSVGNCGGGKPPAWCDGKKWR
jgi:hypothetical protein